MRTGDLVYLKRVLHTEIGCFAAGQPVAVLIDDEQGVILVCTDLGHHPGSRCHTARVLRKDVRTP